MAAYPAVWHVAYLNIVKGASCVFRYPYRIFTEKYPIFLKVQTLIKQQKKPKLLTPNPKLRTQKRVLEINPAFLEKNIVFCCLQLTYA